MPTLRLLVFLVACSSSFAHAEVDLEAQWRGVAAKQLDDRLRTEWMGIINSETSAGWRIEVGGKTFSGDWVVRHGDGWTYLLDDGTLRCRIQPGDTTYVSCDNADPVEGTRARVALAGRVKTRTVAALDMLHRNVWGKRLGIAVDTNGIGRATLETIVSSPHAETRTSRRYRAAVTFTTAGFAVGTPILVEQYQETCMAVHGCHSTHWSCQRSR